MRSVLSGVHLKASANFPSYYPSYDTCTIAISSNWTGSIDVTAFETESSFDILYVNDMEFSGSREDAQLAGLQDLIPHGDITWTSDWRANNLGWKLCRQPVRNRTLPVDAQDWTCTLGGAPCVRDGQPAACTQWFSDLKDLDGDGSVHNGHPLCNAGELCGPCRCDVGEEQSYFERALLDHFVSQVYISCAPCALGRFRSAADLGSPDGCNPCEAGKFSGVLGQTACEVCEVGTVALSSGMSACSPCSNGTLWVDVGTCDTCDFGFSSQEGATACDACPAGYFSAELPPKCLPCSPGSFGGGLGQSACETCAQGQFTAAVGQSVCEPCRVGTVVQGVGSITCSRCAE